jgi:hypothetical protein
MHRSTYSCPRHLLGVSGQLQARATLPLGNEAPLLIGWEVKWAPELEWTTYKGANLVPTGTRTPTPPGRPARSQSLYRLINKMETIYSKTWL